MADSEIGVLIGRFQPFHFGHAWLIKKAIKKFNKIIILIGSSNINDSNNPWSAEKRKKMLQLFLENEGLERKVIKIDEIIDVPDDDEWLRIALKKIGNRNFAVVGDNEWVNGIFEKAKYNVWRTGYFKRESYEGAKIRKLLINKKNFSDRIPTYISYLIK